MIKYISNLRISPAIQWQATALTKLKKNGSPDNLQIITPNQRLARYLNQAWHNPSSQSQAQPSTWIRPSIYPIHQWLDFHWQTYQKMMFFNSEREGSTLPLLLNDDQTLQLWQQIIAKESWIKDSLIDAKALAKLAQDTYSLMSSYRLSVSDFGDFLPVETERFISWLKAFEHQCDQKLWLTSQQLPTFLWEHYFSQGHTELQHLAIYGFQETPPYFLQLLEQLRSLDISIEKLALSELPDQERSIYDFSSESEELKAALSWAKHKLENNSKKNVRIAIVVPNLSRRRSEIHHLSATQFNEDYNYFLDARQHLNKINISASKPLTDYPIICQSTLLLQLGFKKVDQKTIEALLASPFWESGISMQASMRIRSYLSTIRPRTLSLKQWQQLFEKKAFSVPAFDDLVSFQDQAHWSKLKTLAQWKGLIQGLLAQVSWPGTASLNSENHQLWEAFIDILESLPQQELPTLEHSSIDYYTAINKLGNKLEKTEFQPQALSDQVQILGSLEASGIPFDAVWMLGMDDQQWPPKAKANPLLPVHIQRKFHLPHSSAQREIDFTIAYLNEMLQSAPSIIFSHAEQRGEHSLSLSKLVRPFIRASLKEQTGLPTTENAKTRIKDQFTLDFESFSQDPGLAFNTELRLPGGVSHFKEASLCLFRAYAKYRLKLKHLEAANQDFTPLERGNIIHKILELFWNNQQSQHNLAKLNDEALFKEINTLANQAIQKQLCEEQYLFPKVFIEQEIHRLSQLVSLWLSEEKKRLSFTVKEVEARRDFNINTLKLQAQIDRIDTLEDDSLVLIDYKTGEISSSLWQAEQVKDPQLPIYLCFVETNASAIAFAQIKTNSNHWIVQGKEGLQLFDAEKKRKRKTQNWEEIKTLWKETILKLSKAILSGETSANPLEGISTCNHCHYSNLCRIEKKA